MTSTDTLTILGIVGSLRKGSVNAQTATAAAEMSVEGATVVLHSVADVPLYNGDIEDAGDPASVLAMKKAVREADGVVFFTPEYNGSFPAVTKNAIDWLSRGGDDAPIKSVAITAVATTPGGRAGAGVLGHFGDIAPRLSPSYFGKTLGIGRYTQKVDDRGKLIDVEALEELKGFLEAFATFARGD